MMPVFEHYCEKCDDTQEDFFQKPADERGAFPPQERACRKCGGVAKLVPSLTASPEIRFAPRWHYGIGAKVSSTSEVNRIAKEKNLMYVGRHHGG
jgi:hypothetical protein